MPASLQHMALYRARRVQLINVTQTAIRVIHPLQRQHRCFNGFAFLANVKAAERLRQPDIVPLPKSAVHIGVVAQQLLA